MTIWLIGMCVSATADPTPQPPPLRPPEYVIQNWTTDDGLPQNTVNAIAHTNDGYLWIGTNCGLARFDGLHFTTYLPGKIPEIGDGRIRSLWGAADGSLWIGTADGRIIRYDNGHFSNNLVSPATLTAGVSLINLMEDASGTIYFSLETGKIGRHRAGTTEICNGTNGWPSGNAQMREGPNADLWVTSQAQCYRVVGDQLRPLLRTAEPRLRQFLCPARHDGYWIYADNKVRLFNDGNWTAEDHAIAPEMGALTHALEDHSKFLWIATSRDGLFRYDTHGNVLHLNRSEGLPDDTVMKLFEDREGNIWAGTLGHGLLRLRPSLFRSYGREQGLASGHVTGAFPDQSGRLWISTADNGLHLLEKGQIREIVPKSRMAIVAVDVDDSGLARALDIREGIIETNGSEIKYSGALLGKQENLTGFFKDQDGTLWACGEHQKALTGVLNGQLKTIPFPIEWGTVTICSMARGGEGTLWIGSANHGLLGLRENKWIRVTPEANSFAAVPIWCMLANHDGSLWFGTKGAGIMRWKEGRLDVCNMSRGLADDVISGMVEDGLGSIWCASHNGVFRVNQMDLERCLSDRTSSIHCIRYGRSDGLPSMECTGGYYPGAQRGIDGQLYFPTWNGLAVVNPNNVLIDPTPPKVHIEKMQVDGAPIAWDDQVVNLSSATRNIEFQFAGVNFMAPEEVRFQTRLSNHTAGEWKDNFGENQIRYQNLSPGDYQFEVIASNRDGIWNQQPSSIAFTIQAAFWQTTWFWTAMAMVTGSSLIWLGRMIAQRRNRQRIAELEKLQAVESERLRIARDIHDSLGARASQIGFLANIEQPTTERLAAIRETAKDLARSLDETVWLVSPQCDTLRHLSDYLIQYAEETFRPAGLECHFDLVSLPNLPLAADTRHHLFLATKEACANILKHAAATEVQLEFSLIHGVFSIAITDNGSGFDHPLNGVTRNGLQNMSHRLTHVGGSFTLRTSRGMGTTVTFRLPIANAPKQTRKS